ncbi:MAG TPA: ion channel [Rhabdaerophilum sp.]|nr:ion channel [Rhabdaerophilum sp.]
MAPTTRGLQTRLHALYFGDDRVARRFRYALVAFDAVTIALFIVSSFVSDAAWIIPADFGVGLLLLVEMAARLLAAPNRRKQLFSLATAADLVVIVSLLAPAFVENLGFLRIARALRVLRSYHLLRDLRQDSAWFRLNEDVIQRTVNLFVFIFIVTSVVYVTQHGSNPHIETYMDALYFTMTTLTTTGFGDITLQGNLGRFIAVLIMVVGVSLFLRLLQAVFRPHKVRFECADCGLLVHDADAVHCKHCGKVLRIPTEGLV